jgi:hypothetical protein
MTAADNLRLIAEIEANREFLLGVYRQNPTLLARAEPRIRQLFEPLLEVPVVPSDGGRPMDGVR